MWEYPPGCAIPLPRPRGGVHSGQEIGQQSHPRFSDDGVFGLSSSLMGVQLGGWRDAEDFAWVGWLCHVFRLKAG